ncbi:MAG: translocation/assembly module TamB domain-containing protein [Alphaproteobacteria bacterium]|nr:translocation/assembly module TamB domain-containing protein [Alphaproteobacteria bacterium]
MPQKQPPSPQPAATPEKPAKRGWPLRFLYGTVVGSVVMVRHWMAWLLTVFAILLLCAYGFMMYLQTDDGKAWLGETVSRIASTDDLAINLRFDAVTFSQVSIPHLTAADKKGVFLEITDIDLGINAKTYFLFRPVADRLNIDRVYLARLPEMPENKKTKTPAPARSSLPEIAGELREFNIREIHAGAAVYGQEQFFSLKSRVALSPRLAENDIDIVLGAAEGRQKSETTHLHLRVKSDTPENLEIDMALRDAAGGMVTRLMGLPAGYDVDFTLQGAGAPHDWRGTSQIRLGRELSGHFLLRLKNNQRLLIDADLKGPRQVSVKGNLDLPLQVSPPVLPVRSAMSGSLTTTLDLRSLTLLLGLDDHRATGTARLSLNISGSLQQPVIEGTGSLRDATYESLAAGVKLSALRADISATRSDIRLSNLSARTPQRGSISGSAAVSLRDIKSPSFSFSVALDRAQVLGLQNAQVQASGSLSGSGTSDFVDIGGDITVNRAEIYLAGFGSSSAANMLNIVEINVPPHLRRAKRQGVIPEAAYRLNLDVRVSAPRAVFVRGQGLDSEWSAKAHVRGTADDPQVDGELRLIRGKYEFFDALLTFDSGLVDFRAGNVTNPDLDIKGRVKGKQVTANIAVAGSAQAPEVTLTSTPQLPQDEILSRVFFDKSVTELTPMEMVRVAQIIGVMSGRMGGGIDPITQLRKKAGIDMLSVNRDDKTGDTSVSVGKYLSEGIYMSVDQGLNTEGSAVKLQIELRPNLQLETRVGNDSDNSVGINWKKDY